LEVHCVIVTKGREDPSNAAQSTGEVLMFTAEHFKTWASMLLGIAVAAVPLFGNAEPFPATMTPKADQSVLSQVSWQSPDL
jgi:hypothetical protein